MISVTDRIENIVGKRENAVHQRFLLFPQYFPTIFSQTSPQESLKVGIVWQEVKYVQFNSTAIIIMLLTRVTVELVHLTTTQLLSEKRKTHCKI